MKIFGFSIWAILMAFFLIWAGYKYGANIPVIKNL